MILRDPEHWVDLDRDRVTLDGKPVAAAPRLYILLYKPTGYLTTYRDPAGRPTVYDLVGDAGTWLSPVGRLDLETSGLLLLTNDNDFGERVMNPEHKIPKTYQVKAATLLTDEQLQQLRQGVVLHDGPTSPAEVRRLRDGARHTHLEITITEGRNRQVRRMLEAVGSKVLKLVRVAIGPLRIGDLQIGKWKKLGEEEVRLLWGPGAGGRGPGRRTPSSALFRLCQGRQTASAEVTSSTGAQRLRTGAGPLLEVPGPWPLAPGPTANASARPRRRRHRFPT